MPISPVPPKSPCQVHATFTPHTQQTVNRFPLPLSQDVEKTLVLMWLAKFANDASSMVQFRSSPWHIPCHPYGRLSIVVHYPSVSIRAAQSGLQSVPAYRMQWGCHHLFRSYDGNPSNIANIRLHSVSGHTIFSAKVDKKKEHSVSPCSFFFANYFTCNHSSSSFTFSSSPNFIS